MTVSVRQGPTTGVLARQLERSEGGLEGPRGPSPALVALDQLNVSRPSSTSKASGGGTRGGCSCSCGLDRVVDDRQN